MEVVSHEIELREKPAVLDDGHLVNFVEGLDFVIVVDESIDKIVGITIFANKVLSVEVLVDAVGDHALAYSRFTQRYII